MAAPNFAGTALGPAAFDMRQSALAAASQVDPADRANAAAPEPKQAEKCPACVMAGINPPGRITARPGVFSCSVLPDHKWFDHDGYRRSVASARSTRPDAYPPPPKPVVEQAEVIVIDAKAKERLEKELGAAFNCAADLIGEVFALNKEVKRLEAESAAAFQETSGGQAARGLAYNQVVFTVPDWVLSYLQTHANQGQLTLQQYMQQWLGDVIDREYGGVKEG